MMREHSCPRGLFRSPIWYIPATACKRVKSFEACRPKPRHKRAATVTTPQSCACQRSSGLRKCSAVGKNSAATSLALLYTIPVPSFVYSSNAFIKQYYSTFKMTPMAQRLSGKTVLITGASSGIGCSIAFEFARTAPDMRLILAARRTEKLEQISKDIQKEVGSDVRIHAAQLDVSKPDEVKNFVQNLPAEFQDIDILVNNAYKLLISVANPTNTNDKMQRTRHGHSAVS
jgi:hypothetical protein